jgi:Caspase domain
MRLLWTVAVLVFTICASLTAGAASRVALVIGNGAYTSINPLPNPANDASDMAATLEKLGFTVFGGNDLDYVTMGAKVGEFADAAADAEVTLFFYAGHGVQVNGRNYLIPVNAKLEREATLQFEAIDSELVLGVMSGPDKTAIALLDACRDNPLPRSVARKRSTTLARGLAAPTMAGGGMLIGFATSPQETAADGTPGSRNSPFTQALLKHINTPGLEIQSLMTRVKSEVYVSTKQEQQPWHNSSLREEFYLVPQGKSDVEQPVAPSQRSIVEVEWEAMKNSKSIAALNAFIAKHQDQPVYLALAQERLDELQQQKTTALLDSLLIKKKPEQPEQTQQPEQGAKDLIKELALNAAPEQAEAPEQRQASSEWSLQQFFEIAKTANAGNAKYALLSLPSVDIPAPAKNAGAKSRSLKLNKIADAPALEVLLSSNPQLTFTKEATTTCLLHWVDRCPFLSRAVFDGLSAAMNAADLDIMNGANNFYGINRIAGSSDYLITNNPKSGNVEVTIAAAVVSEDLQVKQVFAFDVTPSKLGASAGSPDADILLTWSALEGDDLYVSFDATHRCTDGPRKFGFMVKFSLSDRSVKWVSPFSVVDANFIIRNDYIVSSNGGSCVDDFVYKLNKDTGEILGRFKTPSAVEYMDGSSGSLVLQLYDGAAAYQLD